MKNAGRANHNYKHGLFTGYGEYRHGVAVPVKRPEPVFQAEQRQHIIGRLVEIMSVWTQSPFQFEGAARSSVRSNLCLHGVEWAQADAEAASLVQSALGRMRAVRPTWEQGQKEYTIPRENCAWCYIPIPDDLIVGSHHKGFCCPEHARVAIELRDLRSVGETQAAYRAAADVIYRAKNPARPCEHCDRTFRPKNPDAQYCSHRCSTEATVLPDKPCAQCGAMFHPSTIGTQYCSTACRDASMRILPIKACENPACGKSFQTQHYAHQKYCSSKCHHEHREAMAPEFENECSMCGTHFISRHHPATLCSQTCKTRKSQAGRGVFPKSLRPWVLDYILTATIRSSNPEALTPSTLDKLLEAA